MGEPREDVISTQTPLTGSNLTKIAGSREVTEAQAAIMVAKNFPRSEIDVLDKITLACQRPALAESALFEYSRGGNDITGPTIRLAETLFRLWGNSACGIRELESGEDESTLQAYAVDFETNVRQEKTFTVRHMRYTKQGSYKLTGDRDRYENLANFGARRLRACILSLIPSDIVDAAVREVEKTLNAEADTSEGAMKRMVAAFHDFGITKGHVEQRIQRRLDAITPMQVINLVKIYNSLKDGMSKPKDWFDVPSEEEKAAKDLGEDIKEGKKPEEGERPDYTAEVPEEDNEEPPETKQKSMNKKDFERELANYADTLPEEDFNAGLDKLGVKATGDVKPAERETVLGEMKERLDGLLE